MEIKIEIPSYAFSEHLKLDSNSRVLFSGKFGVGKSYFLKKFFSQETENYNLFWISPLNYVVGANQDIFEWIKIDLAKFLITDHLQPPSDSKVSRNLLIQSFIYKNAGAIFETLIGSLANKYLKTKTAINLLDDFKIQIEEYKKFESENQEKLKPDFHKLQSFLNIAFQVKGSIYEDDITTQTIRVSLRLLKHLNPKKENVLVIDDLDRLDPEHIFRILNILSAHNDHFDSNKFGFEKVIVVCDYDNIKSLYQYKYGDSADFEGYIEKFFTYEPFYYSLTDSLISYCEDGVISKKLDTSTKITISLILKLLLKSRNIRTRHLKKVFSEHNILKPIANPKKKFTVKPHNYGSIHIEVRRVFFNSYNFEIDFDKFDILKGLQLISIACGGVDKLKDILIKMDPQTLTNTPIDKKYLKDILDSMLVCSHIAKNISTKKESDIFFIWRHLNNDNQFKIVEAAFPTTIFFETKITLQLKWDDYNHYIQGDYFDSINPIYGLQEFLNNDNPSICNYKSLIGEVLNILDLIITEKIFTNIKC